MLAWSRHFPARKKPLAYLRLIRARHRFWARTYLGIYKGKLNLRRKDGYQESLVKMRDKHKNQAGFILCNGPSLNDMDLKILKNQITIGCNGIYKGFEEMGFSTNYLIFEDIEQTEIRGAEIPKIKGPLKLASLYNAYAFKADANTVFFNSGRTHHNSYYWDELYPQFSRDFASIVHLGSTVSYIMLQWAYHLGCNPVYVLGLDHDYGELPKLFPPGKITITKQNIERVRGLHFSDDYYQIGDQIGVPDVERQEEAYSLARDVFEEKGRTVINLTPDSKLKVFETGDWKNISIKLPKGVSG